MLALLVHIVAQAREQEEFSREGVPAEERVWVAFLYYSGLSYRKVSLVLDHSHETVPQRCYQIYRVVRFRT